MSENIKEYHNKKLRNIQIQILVNFAEIFVSLRIIELS
jgi:hypothetical protein